MMQRDKLCFEDMTEETVSAVYAIASACFTDCWSEAIYRRELNNPFAITLVAKYDGVVCAYLNSGYAVDEISINSIAVSEPFRRKGIAAEMIQALVERTSEFGKYYFLEVRKSNTPARALYRSLNFEEVGLRKGYYHDPEEDAIIMTMTREDKHVAEN